MSGNLASAEKIAQVAQRLRATSGTGSTNYKQGFAEGVKWAQDEAELDDLELLAGVSIDDELGAALDGAIEVATNLAKKMGADDAAYLFDEGGQDDWRADSNFKITANRLRGFVAGALAVYNETKPML